MTDAELEQLFRKHIRAPAYVPDPKHHFLGTGFYDFARELEHLALAPGMMMARETAAPPEKARPAPPEPVGLIGAIYALIGWASGKG